MSRAFGVVFLGLAAGVAAAPAGARLPALAVVVVVQVAPPPTTEGGRDGAAEAAVEAERREQAGSAAESAPEAEPETEERAAAGRNRAAEERARFLRWVAGGAAGVLLFGLVLWLAGRRAVAKARRGQARAESLAQAAREDLADGDDRERPASAVPNVLLEGADGDGRPVVVRVPGGVIAADGGAVVGRSPFESAIVIDHAEVSRGHFRLCARDASVFVEDLRSTNGTAVDGVALAPGAAAPLPHGAGLRVGGLTFTVTLDAEGTGGPPGGDPDGWQESR